MTDPEKHLIADVLDRVEMRLDLVEPYRFEGNTSIPIPSDIDGDFGKRVPQRR